MTLEELSGQLPELLGDIRKSERKTSLAALGALLLQPDLQSNSLRIEGLVHLVDAYANGSDCPTDAALSSWFEQLGLYVGHLEDPAEDVFVGYVGTSVGGFRVLEGLWEGNSFYTEVVLRAVEKIPADDIKNTLLRPAYTLLRLSEILAERTCVKRYQMGSDLNHDELPKEIAKCVCGNSNLVTITNEELSAAGIDKGLLRPFIRSERAGVETNFLENSILHKQPLLDVEDGVMLVLPTAVGMAIRLFVITSLDSWGLLPNFQRVLCAIYAEFFEDQSLLGRSAKVPMGPIGNDIFSGGLIEEFDEGRYFHFLPIIPSLNGISERGMVNVSELRMHLGEHVDEQCASAFETVAQQDGFVEIVHIICIGGVGEGITIPLSAKDTEQSRKVTLSAHDLRTLSDLQDFDLAEIIRVLDMRDQDREHGISVMNVNGFINLVGWLRANDGFTLPPHIEGVELGDGLPFLLNFDSNMQRNLRAEAYSTRDAHYETFVDGSQSLVWLYGESYFPEDDQYPVYVEPVMRGNHGMRLLVKCGEKLLWATTIVDESVHHHIRIQKFEIIKTWLPRIANALPESPIIAAMPPNLLVEVAFNLEPRMSRSDSPVSNAFDLTMDQVRDLPLEIEIEPIDAHTIRLNVPSSFDKKCFLKENIAEAMLIEAFVKALSELADYSLSNSELQELVSAIVPNTQARQAHTFLVNNFRQSMTGRLPPIPKISIQDHARMTVSEAWQYHSKEDGFEINGKDECLRFLNAATQGAIDKLVAELSVFNREVLLHQITEYYEAINNDKERWRITASASVALRKDQDAAREVIAQHEGMLARGLTGCRILMEAGLCEAQGSGGRKPGCLDIERLILRALHVFQLGGFSDGVFWDVTSPTVHISPQGQIQIDQSFHREVVELMALKVAKSNIDRSIKEYGIQNETPKSDDATDEELDERGCKFMDALVAEWGLDLDTVLLGVQTLELEGMNRRKPVFALSKDEIVQTLGTKLTSSEITAFMDNFIFVQRAKWQVIPNGKPDEMFPWRFRRKSSVLRQPILDISSGDLSSYLIVPGLIEEAVRHQFGLMYEGAVRVSNLRSQEMKHWVEVEIGHRESIRFEKRMAERIGTLGVDVKTSVKLTQILKKSLDQNFGDIDILAWDTETGIVWVVECKNVALRKTPGELGEQLLNFRGETRDGKRDQLKKHLDRVDLLRANLDSLREFLELTDVSDVRSVLLFPNPVPMQYSQLHCQDADIVLVQEIENYFSS